MPFQLENGTDYIGLEIADQIWLENDTSGIKWKRCCCQTPIADCGNCCCSSTPCVLPKADLTVSWVNSITGNGSDKLTWDGTGNFLGVCINNVLVQMNCTSFLTVYYHTGGTNCNVAYRDSCGTGGAIGHKIALSTHNCNPLSLVFNIVSTDCPFLYTAGFSSFTVTGTTYGVSNCCQTFHVTGCAATALSGVTVSIYDTNGGTLLAQGVTPASGSVTLLWSGSCGVYVTATKSGELSYGKSLTLTAAGTTDITLFPPTLYATICGTTFTLNRVSNTFAGASQLYSDNVAVVGSGFSGPCTWLGGTMTDWAIINLSISCPSSSSELDGSASTCVKGSPGGNALCPGSSTTQGVSCTCSAFGADCGVSDIASIVLTGTIETDLIAVTGAMPTATPNGYGLPCPGESIAVTN